ncbi:MAG: ALIX V-shaped domain binding to HIV-domain-containing protein, partial [Olpidium bornovanus]
MIYHAVVPNTNTLQSMEKQPLTAPVSLTELYSTAEAQKVVGVDVFHRLIPLSVHQSASVYSEETAKLLRAEQEKSDIADAEAAAALEYMRLPGALDKFRDEDAGRVGSGGVQALAEPPANVREAALVVAQAEAQVPMADLVGALDRLRAEAYRMLDEVRQSLDQEQRECESLRALPLCTLSDAPCEGPSGPLTTSIRQDLRRHGEAMDRAMSADKSTLGRWEAIRGDVDLMSRGPEALDRAYAEVIAAAISAVRSAGSDVKPAVSLLDFDVSIEDTMASKIAKVEECMGKLNRLKKDRLDTLKDLRTLSQIFQSALEKFRPHQTRLAAAAHHQQALIQELTKAYKALLQQEEGRRLQLEWDTAERRRSEFAEQLKVSAGTYDQAVLFYNNITDLIRAVSRTAREFVNRRAEERNALVNTLETRRSEREQQMLNERLSRLTSPLAPSAPPQPPAQAPPTPPGLARGFGLPSAPVGDEYG